jgi:ferredoxin-like protein FixX
VSHPKTINIEQYLNTNNFSVNNRHFVIKSSQATQLYKDNQILKSSSDAENVEIDGVTKTMI